MGDLKIPVDADLERLIEEYRSSSLTRPTPGRNPKHDIGAHNVAQYVIRLIRQARRGVPKEPPHAD